MFIQVIQGTVSDGAKLRAALDRWVEEQAPEATGWLGTTAGVTDDGRFIALARFESEEAARANNDRPEQGEWWSETAKLFSGVATFHDCREVVQWGQGGSDDAGFVQVIQGRVTDEQRMRELSDQADAAGADYRTDVLGGVVALHGGGAYTNAVYFTSEVAAREGEQKEPPAELKALMDEQMSLFEGPPTFFDLRDPWLTSPK
jgi:hypothetical protein